MKIKSKLLSIMLIIFPLLITVGFSAWIIIYEFSFKPDYNDSTIPLSNYFNAEQSTTYNGAEQVPSPKDGTTIDLTGIAYKYKLETNSNFTIGKPINAGVYDVVISLDGYSDCKIKFTINKKKVKPASSTINLDYNSSYTSWDAFQTAIYDQVTYIDDEKNNASELSMANCFINGIHNGLYYYGTVDNQASYELGTSIGTDRIIGTTYQAVITMADNIKDNYEWINNKIIIKYKTAKVGSTYYTIEDAINNTSGTITFEGNLSNTSFVATSFCNLTKSEGNPYTSTTFNLTSRTLIVPYEASTTDHATTSSTTSSGSVYSALIITNDITINVKSGSTLTAAAFIGFAQPKITVACNRGVIMNYGTINIESGGKVTAYGYIKGSGTLNLASGATALDCMTTYDWPGGTAGSKMYSDVMPTNAWSIHNISCDTYIYAGSTYNGYVHIILSSTAKDTTAAIIGSSKSANCIFKITSGCIKKTTIKADAWTDNHANAVALNTIIGSNQIAGQRDVIELLGTCEDGTLSISMSALIFNVKMESSTSIPAPISFMDVYIRKGSKITLAKSDYMFLPGSKFVVDEGSELIIGPNVDVSIVSMNDFTGVTGVRTFTTNYCVDKVDAICIVNGKLEVTSGSLGGLIQTTSEGAILNLGSVSSLTSTFISMYDTNSPYYFTKTCTVNGNINGTNGNFEQKMYISSEVSTGVYGWNVSDNVTTFTLNFYDYNSKTLLQTTKIYVLNDSSGNASYTITGNEYAPTKMHYDFSKWLDSSGNDLTTSLENRSIVLTKTGTTEYSLYASWTEHEYSFAYTAGYKETEDSGFEDITSDEVFQKVLKSFKISDFNAEGVLSIPTTAKYNTYMFYGWYVGISSQYIDKQINSITIEQLETFVASYGNTIPLFCYFSNIVTYEITFVDNNDEIKDASIVNVVQGNTIPLPNVGNQEYTNYDNDITKQKYFYGWYADSSFTKPVDANVNVENLDTDKDTKITLYGKWEAKTVIKFQYKNNVAGSLETIEDSKYLMPGQKLYMPEINDFSIINDKIDSFNQDYTFSNWYLNGTAYNSSSYVATEKEDTFYAYYLIKHYANISITTSNATVSVKVDGTPYNTSEQIRIEIKEEIGMQATMPTNVSKSVNLICTYTGGGGKVNVTWNDSSSGKKDSPYEVNYTLKGNSTLDVTGSSCLAEGTLILMGDGTTKTIEEIKVGDIIKVWDFEKGTMQSLPVILLWNHGTSNNQVLNLEFSYGNTIKVISDHGFFDYATNKFEIISIYNYKEYLGHTFAYWDNGQLTAIKLDNAYITNEYTGSYSLETAYFGNAIAEGLLTLTPQDLPSIFEFFEVGDNFKYETDKMLRDIEKYGLYTYDDWSDYLTQEEFDLFNGRYYKILVGKGIITEDDIVKLIKNWLK